MRVGADAAKELLSAAVGSDSVREAAALSVDGCELTTVVSPRDGESLASALRVLDEGRLGTVIWGGGSRLSLGNPPRDAAVLLATHGLDAVEVFEPGDGVARVLGGTTLAGLRDVVRPEGWDVPLDPWGRGSTVGGALAAAALGPRRLGFGPARDCVLGLEVALASGERTRCGGRVVKNVTGYDLAKLYTGSLGSLGVIEAAWLRLRPNPEAASVHCAELAFDEHSISRGLEVARRPSARAVGLLDPATARRLAEALPPGFDVPELRSERWLLVAEFAGDEPAVHRDARWLQEEIGGTVASWHEDDGEEVIEALRALQGGEPPSSCLRARLAALPSGLPGVVAGLVAGDDAPQLLVYPGLGLVYAELPLEADETRGQPTDAAQRALEHGLARIDAAAARGDAEIVLETLPAWAKAGRDVFGDGSAALPLALELKRRFDPNGILNPGRFQGRL